MSSTAKGVLRIGSLRVDPAVDEIEREGQIVKLEPKAMRLLLCLAEHAGEVVSVEQLLEKVWTDVIVTPDSVYQAVTGLRRVLGDDPKKPTYIANVVRRGYRLVAPMAPWVDPPTLPSPPTAPPPLTPAPAPARLPSPVSSPDIASPKHAKLYGTVIVVLLIAVILGLGIVGTRQIWRSTQGNTAASSSVVVSRHAKTTHQLNLERVKPVWKFDP
jgi:transcriptional activator of cad operon